MAVVCTPTALAELAKCWTPRTQQELLAWTAYLACQSANGGGGGGSGTVTSVSGSGGTTGLTLTGGPITTSGTLTLGGTLGIANGGTGQSNAAAALTALGGVGAATTDTFTNKRITRRVVALVDAATVTLASDSTDLGILTTLSQASQFLNPSGTPTDGQEIEVRVKSTSARALTWDTQFRGSTSSALPTITSGGSLTDRFWFEWNAADTKWDFTDQSYGY